MKTNHNLVDIKFRYFMDSFFKRERGFWNRHQEKFPWRNLEPDRNAWRTLTTFQERYEYSIRPQHRRSVN